MGLIRKKLLNSWLYLVLAIMAQGWRADASPSPRLDSQGTIFIREKIAGVEKFKDAIRELSQNFKANGFLAYSLHRDLKKPDYLILTLQCSNLGRGVTFLRSKLYKSAMEKVGVMDRVQWAGVDVTPRQYGELPPPPAGIVIARNDLKSYDYWKTFFDAEHNPSHGGKNPNKGEGYHAERHYLASHFSIHRGLGKPDTVYVAHEASDISKAPEFMTSPPMETMKGPLGITRFTVWYGINIEQGVF